MSDVTMGFMPRPRRHSAQSADSRADVLKTQRFFVSAESRSIIIDSDVAINFFENCLVIYIYSCIFDRPRVEVVIFHFIRLTVVCCLWCRTSVYSIMRGVGYSEFRVSLGLCRHEDKTRYLHDHSIRHVVHRQQTRPHYTAHAALRLGRDLPVKDTHLIQRKL